MPTIARIRIINFNFNEGDRFGDETYEIAPHTTKFHAANGFGKSVLDQVIMSPFVSEKSGTVSAGRSSVIFLRVCLHMC